MTWKTQALAAIRELAQTRDTFTSDDLYALVGPPPGHVNQVGSVFREANALGICHPTGSIKKSVRPEAKRRNIQVWTRGRVETLQV